MELPKYKSTSKKGKDGITILTRIIEKELGWIVRPNHNETDFGIDIYLDIITEFGQVSGKTIAAQIKTGASYFSECNEVGWVYRDELSHLNYYLNHDIPVVIFLVDDSNENAFWCYCDPMKTERTDKQWKITIPRNQRVDSDSKNKLLEYVSPVKDYVAQLNHFWEENNQLKETEKLIFIIEKEDILNNSYESIKAGLERIQANLDLVKHLRSKVEILIHGYDFDKRELPEIPEVRSWAKKIFSDTIGLSYFLSKYNTDGFFCLLKMCFMKYKKIPNTERYEMGNTKYKIEMDLTDTTFLELAFDDLNRFTDKHNLSIEVNKKVSFEIGESVTGEKWPLK